MNTLPEAFRFKLTGNMVDDIKFILWVLSTGVKLPSYSKDLPPSYNIDEFIKNHVMASAYSAFAVEDGYLKVLVAGKFDQEDFDQIDDIEIKISEVELLDELTPEMLKCINAAQVVSDVSFVFSRLDPAECDSDALLELELLTKKFKHLMLNVDENIYSVNNRGAETFPKVS
jgi:hypothetical protein